MKKYKTYVAFLVVFLGLSLSYGQKNKDEDIKLPDVSTVVQGGAPKAGRSAIPDYSEVLPVPQTDDIVPQMPQVKEDNTTTQSTASYAVVPEKSVYAEGFCGVGYPDYFIGNFSLYKEGGNNPFRLDFGHDSQNGYAGNALSSGFYDKNTFVRGYQGHKTLNSSFNVEGLYKSSTLGLQGKSPIVSDVTREVAFVDGSMSFNLTNNFTLSLDLDGALYRRYGTVQGDLESLQKKLTVLDFNPNLDLTYEYKTFYLKLGSEYTFEYDTTDVLAERSINRTEFMVGFGFKDESYDIFIDSGTILGNGLQDNTCIIPFDVKTSFNFILPLSSRKTKLGVSGGLDSFLPLVRDVEESNKYSYVPCLIEEESFWYGKAFIALPIKNRLSLNVDFDFKTTAYNNEKAICQYKSLNKKSGQYTYLSDSWTEFKTDINASYQLGPSSIGVSWVSSWQDVMPNENENEISASVSLQGAKCPLSYTGEVGFAIGSEDDKVPNVAMEVQYKVSDAIRIALECKDLIKLVSGESRTYAGDYITRSGNVALLARFFF